MTANPATTNWGTDASALPSFPDTPPQRSTP
jgi:hypothetical protein